MKKWKPVLEVGSGKNPHLDSDVLVDLYPVDVEDHRHGTSITIDRPFVQADVQNLPFKDKVFSFVHCHHVLEHVPDPVKACEELSRVADAGLVTTPTKVSEYLHSPKTHRWFCTYKKGLLLFEKKPKNWSPPTGNLFKRLWDTNRCWSRIVQEHPKLFHLKVEWKGALRAKIIPFEELQLKDSELDEMIGRTFTWKSYVPQFLYVSAARGTWYPRLKGFLRLLKGRKKIDLKELMK